MPTHLTQFVAAITNEGSGYPTIADPAALTAATPAALTSPAGGAGSGANGTTFNGAECDALRADVVELRTQLAAVVADNVALHANNVAILARLEAASISADA